MGHINGEITSPVSTDDIRLTIGENSDDIGTLCMSGKVNRYSKIKPMNVGGKEDLQPEEFAGTAQQTVNGIVYGMRCASSAGNLDNIHELDWSYVGVPTEVDPARFGDFKGYDHKAGACPKGSLDVYEAEAGDYINYHNGMTLAVDFDFSNARAGSGLDVNAMIDSDDAWVSVQDIIAKLTNGDSLANYYPCACIRINNTNYIRALAFKPEAAVVPGTPQGTVSGSATQNPAYGYGQMVSDSNALRNRWTLELAGLEEAAGYTLKNNDTITISIFFMKAVAGTVGGISIDFQTWKPVSSASVIAQLRAFGCPEAVGKVVKIRLPKKGLEGAQPMVVDDGPGVAKYGFKMNFYAAEEWETNVPYYVSGYVTSLNGETRETYQLESPLNSYTFTTAPTGGETTGGLKLSLRQLTCYPFASKPTGNYSYHWEVRYGNPAGEIVNSGNGTFTVVSNT